MEQPTCPICGADTATKLFAARDRLLGRSGEFGVVRCDGCGLVYLSPRPTPDALAAYYPDTYYPIEEPPTPAAVASADGTLATITAWLATQQLDHQPRMLDIGCGTGVLLHRAEQQGIRTSGVEISPAAVHYARTRFGLDVVQGTLDDVELAQGSFDIVTMWHVLEHLHDPVGTLQQIHTLLAPGGLLLLAVPNFGSIEARLFGRRWFSLDAPRHLLHFTPATLTMALHRAGFPAIRIAHSTGTAGLVYSIMGDLTGLSLKLRHRQLAGSTYRRCANLLHYLALPVTHLAARLQRGGALEAQAIKPTIADDGQETPA